MSVDESRQEVGRRLDLHHEPSLTGVIDVCAICGINTDDGYATGRRHLPQPNEVDRARSFLTLFARLSPHPPPEGVARRVRWLTRRRGDRR
jgi:hypothetical protein